MSQMSNTITFMCAIHLDYQSPCLINLFFFSNLYAKRRQQFYINWYVLTLEYFILLLSCSLLIVKYGLFFVFMDTHHHALFPVF